jgi:hypothetical protein
MLRANKDSNYYGLGSSRAKYPNIETPENCWDKWRLGVVAKEITREELLVMYKIHADSIAGGISYLNTFIKYFLALAATVFVTFYLIIAN